MLTTGQCRKIVFLCMITSVAVSVVNCYLVNVHNQPTVHQSATVGQHIRLACIESRPATTTNATKFHWSRSERTAPHQHHHRDLLRNPRIQLDPTDGTLHIRDAVPTDSGHYKCSATSSRRRIDRRHTVLKVVVVSLASVPAVEPQQPAEVASQATLQVKMTAGDSISIACIADTQLLLNSNNVFSWYRGNRSMLSSDSEPPLSASRFHVNPADGTLNINDARTTDSDHYTCVVPYAPDLIYQRTTDVQIVMPDNKGHPTKRDEPKIDHNDVDDYTVRVETEPFISLRAAVGDHIRLTCIESLRLTNASFFNWYRANSTQLGDTTDTDPRFRIDPADGSLYIDDAQMADSDHYKCVVPHAVDLIYRGTTLLSVDSLVAEDDRRSDDELPGNLVVVDGQTTTSTTQSTPQTTPTDGSHSATVLVEPQPSSDNDGLKQMRVSWSPLNHTGDEAASGLIFRVLLLRTDDAQPRWIELYADDLQRTFVDVTVATFGRYVVQVQLTPQSQAHEFLRLTGQKAYDRHTFGYPSEGVPSVAPSGLRQCDVVANDTPAAVCLEWNAVEASAVNGRLHGYRVRTWYEDNEGVQTAEQVTDVVGALRTVVEVSSGVATGLGGGYYASVAVLNGRSMGPVSAAISLGEV